MILKFKITFRDKLRAYWYSWNYSYVYLGISYFLIYNPNTYQLKYKGLCLPFVSVVGVKLGFEHVWWSDYKTGYWKEYFGLKGEKTEEAG